jgi:SAM-dependent methyltransferase
MDANLSSPYQDKMDPWSSHMQIIHWLQNQPKGTVVLDVGTATGILGRQCAGHGLRLKGIEPREEWAELARPYYEEITVCPIEAVRDDFLRAADVVVLADVLEHLKDPEAVLKRIVRLQPDGSRLLVSVPNIAHLWVRLHLLLGHFDYTERGLLDRTHLHFYTRSTFLSLLQNCGLQVENLNPTTVPLNLIHPFFQNHPIGRQMHALLASVTRRLPTLLGYQFVAFTRKLPDDWSKEGMHEIQS